MNTNHAKAIKGMSIANIVLAALGIFGMLIAWAGLGVGGAAQSLTAFARLVATTAYQNHVTKKALMGITWYPVV